MLGLVFGGGGGKGAYQVGVWKALREYGVDSRISAVSGTSVGALNGAMFSTGNLEGAVKAWENINEKEILTHQEILRIDNIFKSFPHGFEGGWFTNEGYKKMLRKYADFDAIITSDVRFFATASQLFKKHRLYDYIKKLSECNIFYKILSVISIKLLYLQTTSKHFSVNKHGKETIEKILLASAAIPLVFPDIEINGRLYIDGGIKENVPISPLYNRGYRKIVAVTLDKNKKTNIKPFKEAEIVFISLDEENFIKNMADTFDFNPEHAKIRMQLGYDDCKANIKEVLRLIQ